MMTLEEILDLERSENKKRLEQDIKQSRLENRFNHLQSVIRHTAQVMLNMALICPATKGGND